MEGLSDTHLCIYIDVESLEVRLEVCVLLGSWKNSALHLRSEAIIYICAYLVIKFLA